MSIAEIQKRLAAETRIHEIAVEIRKLLDDAAKLDLPDGRSGDDEALALATED